MISHGWPNLCVIHYTAQDRIDKILATMYQGKKKKTIYYITSLYIIINKLDYIFSPFSHNQIRNIRSKKLFSFKYVNSIQH